MSANNLRIVYKNLADTSTITASTTAGNITTPTNNLKLDTKSKVYRSATGSTNTTAATLVIDSNSTITANCVVLAFTNLTAAATIRVRAYSTTVVLGSTVDTEPTETGTLVSTPVSSGADPVPYQQTGLDYWGIEVPSTTTIRHGYARIYFSNTSARTFVITITDTNNPDKFIEISRLIMGTYWSPKYNTSYGLSKTTKDLSTSERSEAGDLVTLIKPSYDTLSFDMKFLNAEDRTNLQKIIKNNGTTKSIFVSLFPENEADFGKEQMYQIYGRMSQLFPVDHPLYEMYGSQLDIEEV